MEDFNQDNARIAETARLPAVNGCPLGKAWPCTVRGNPSPCRSCGWLASEVERRRKLPLWRNEKGLWQKRVGTK